MKKFITQILVTSLMLATSTWCAAQGKCFVNWKDGFGNALTTSSGGPVLSTSVKDCDEAVHVEVLVFKIYNLNDLDMRSRASLEGSLSDIFFDFDKYEMKQAGKAKLDELAEAMKENKSYGLVVRGFADKTGSNEYNAKLSLERASAVKSYLTSKGVSADRLIAQGYGEKDPISPWNQDLNRRVEFIAIIPK